MSAPLGPVHSMSVGVTGRNSDSSVLRMPEGMRGMLKVRAAQNRRSMNAEIIALIEAGLATDASGVERTPWHRLRVSSPAEASELLMAELIIATITGLLPAQLRQVADEQLVKIGVAGADPIRSQERRAAIIAGGAA